MAKRKKTATSAEQPPAARKVTATLEQACDQHPKKKRPRGPVRPVFTTHKVRSKWFQAREAWPQREAPVARLIRERARADLEVPDVVGPEQSRKPARPISAGE
jgi:hypothetical protein